MQGTKRKYGGKNQGPPNKKPRTTYRKTNTFYVPARVNTMEKKSYDIASATYGTDANTASITSIFNPVQGTTLAARIGTKVVLKSISIRGQVANDVTTTNPPTTAAVPSSSCRLTLLMDRQPNAALPSITTIFTGTTNISDLNLANRDRFKVLHTEDFWHDAYISSTNAATACNQGHTVKVYKKVNIPVFFNANNAGDVTDITSNSILMVWQSNYDAAATGTVAAVVTTRCRFVDP